MKLRSCCLETGILRVFATGTWALCWCTVHLKIRTKLKEAKFVAGIFNSVQIGIPCRHVPGQTEQLASKSQGCCAGTLKIIRSLHIHGIIQYYFAYRKQSHDYGGVCCKQMMIQQSSWAISQPCFCYPIFYPFVDGKWSSTCCVSLTNNHVTPDLSADWPKEHKF